MAMTDSLKRVHARSEREDKEFVAQTIGVFVLILKESNVPLRKIIPALRHAWKIL